MKSIIITLAAIVMITILEIFAIVYGVDSGAFGVSVAAIAGLGGYQIAKHRINK